MVKSVVFVGLGLFVGASCASMWEQAPSLENRTLWISRDHPGQLEYPYRVCVNHFLGSCTNQKTVKDFYDLNDAATRQKLIDMGFVVKVREKIQ